jgi:beta-glucosidase
VLADIAVPLRCLAHWDTTAGSWAIEPGDFQLHIGRSSLDMPLSVTITISSGTDLPDSTPGDTRC